MKNDGNDISSDEQESVYNEFIENIIEDKIDEIIDSGDFKDNGNGNVIVEIDDIVPPTFDWDDSGKGGGGKGKNGPGDGAEKMRFSVPFNHLMAKFKDRLNLPDLTKEGDGKIKETTEEFKTFSKCGAILSRKRTFKNAIKTSIATGSYNPDKDKWDVLVQRKNKRFYQVKEEEKPKHKAVVCYLGDISYSTYGERLELEKKVVNFIANWLNFNYGVNNVDHRFFVHDSDAHEVTGQEFFTVANAGGTRAAPVFDLVAKTAINEYDVSSTNFYAFYFGDGELFSSDGADCAEIIERDMLPIFNRVGVTEVKPSSISNLVRTLKETVTNDRLRVNKIDGKNDIIPCIKNLFKAGSKNKSSTMF